MEALFALLALFFLLAVGLQLAISAGNRRAALGLDEQLQSDSRGGGSKED